MRRLGIVAWLLVLAGAGERARAQDSIAQIATPLSEVYEVETTGGNRLVGVASIDKLQIRTEELGVLSVAFGSVISIEFGPSEDVVVTQQNSRVRGRVELDALKLNCEFGLLTIERSKLRTLTAITMAGAPTSGGVAPAPPPPTTEDVPVPPVHPEPALEVPEGKGI
jgi:hypothetical protein